MKTLKLFGLLMALSGTLILSCNEDSNVSNIQAYHYDGLFSHRINCGDSTITNTSSRGIEIDQIGSTDQILIYNLLGNLVEGDDFTVTIAGDTFTFTEADANPTNWTVTGTATTSKGHTSLSISIDFTLINSSDAATEPLDCHIALSRYQ